MKKTFLILISFFLFVGSTIAQKIEFTQKSYNFGTLNDEGGPVKYKFVFKNTGNAPLIIFKVESSCGCTTPEWTKTPIQPGKEGMLTVEFAPYDNLGNVSKTVTINSNAETPSLQLSIKANVVKGSKPNVVQNAQ
jgi:hypothetical protein